jgi:hypothetical protein
VVTLISAVGIEARLLEGAHCLLVIREKRRGCPHIRRVWARITWVERRPEGLYFGYRPDRDENGAWGCLMLRDERRPFGLQGIEEIENNS